MTQKSILTQFQEHLTANQLGSSSVALYSDIVRRMNVWLGENYGVDMLSAPENIKGHMLQQWVVSRSGVSESTRHLDFVAARHLMRFLYEGDFVAKDMTGIFPFIKPAWKGDDPEEEESAKVYSPEDIRELLSMKTRSVTSTLRDRALIALIVLTGLRTSEAASLNVGDIRHCKNNTLVVVRKGGKRARVTVPDVAFTIMSDYLETRANAADDEPLFISHHGNRMDRHSIYQRLSPKQKQIGKATGGHALRHTFTTDAARVGGIATAMVLDNHSSFSMTRRYIHASDADRAEVVNSTSIAKALEAAVGQ